MLPASVVPAGGLPTYQRSGFRLGTLSCPYCGFFFPLGTDGTNTRTQCHNCRTVCVPDPNTGMGMFSFDLSPVNTSTTDAFGPKSDVDQRTTEQAYCEGCKKITPCYVYAQQTRGADEGQTIFYQCSECEKEWLLNS